jgi:bidirectional [NiFe] hydrogenase diaphorase subunit
MSVITLTINGIEGSAPVGVTLLEACRQNGVELPTLCHLEGLTPIGACRLCLVQVEGARRLLPACVTEAQEGMDIQTHTEKLMKYRKMTLELLLSERNHICSVCVANGACELRALCAQLGVDHSRFEYRCPDLPPIDTSHERNGLDHNRCISCTRCIRACDQIEGAHTLDMEGRGIESRIIVDMHQSWGSSKTCTKCGKCVNVCPTGTLFWKGSTVAEMEKEVGFLHWIRGGREKKSWSYL